MGLSFQFVVTQFLSAVLVEEAATTPAPGRRLDELDLVATILGKCNVDVVEFLHDVEFGRLVVDIVEGYCFESIDFIGKVITTPAEKKRNPDQCQLSCQRNKDCAFFIWDRESKLCFLKDSDIDRNEGSPCKTCISGPKLCPERRHHSPGFPHVEIVGRHELVQNLQGKLDECILRQPECRKRERVISPGEFVVAGIKYGDYTECVSDRLDIKYRLGTECLEEYIKYIMNKNCPLKFVPADEGQDCTDHGSCDSEHYCSKFSFEQHSPDHPQTCQPKKGREQRCFGDQGYCQDGLTCRIALGGIVSKCWSSSD